MTTFYILTQCRWERVTCYHQDVLRSHVTSGRSFFHPTLVTHQSHQYDGKPSTFKWILR